MTLVRTLGLCVAGLMVLVGLVFTVQGLGYLEGSSMTGDSTWAVIGPVMAVIGVVLGIVVVRSASGPYGPDGQD